MYCGGGFYYKEVLLVSASPFLEASKFRDSFLWTFRGYLQGNTLFGVFIKLSLVPLFTFKKAS